MRAGLRVLVVEDESISAMLLEMILKRFECEIVGSVSTGEEALRVAREARPDLAIMDIGLAGAIDGIEAAARMRDELDLEVLFVSCYEDEATIGRAMALSPIGYIRKPARIDDLRRALEARFEA
jgi:two-component system, response regulator PdtaR